MERRLTAILMADAFVPLSGCPRASATLRLGAEDQKTDRDPGTYLAATVRTILNGHPQSRIENLMPGRFATASNGADFRVGEALTGRFAYRHIADARA